MGVPKFFRYMSERYPCLSQLVQEFEIPEIDNLYLDMNGIIHVCSHPNDFDAHFRISEQEIFVAIFHYIEFLFKTIKPQKLFFMAVDGVAPRAKMNQQRGRRFRSAKEAQDLEEAALKRGEKLPEQARFDSNCITPGTVFMDRLNQQLQYFVTDKITNDPLWKDCSVILSGHETPGEGEHKIMDYIRYLKTRSDYDPNIRHCLYGLDADLIMLGLCTHDPNFVLLREEIKYTKSAQKRIATPEETKFYLLHLSLMRDYLDIEFQELKKTLPYPYDLEKVIDDWVLMGFLVGNDFIPHLPDLHINKGGLEVLYRAYKDVLPTLDGYLNENGILHLKRFQTYLTKVAEFDMDHFEEMQSFTAYIEDKRKEKEFLQNHGLPITKKSEALERLIKESNRALDLDDSEDSDEFDEDDKELLVEEFNLHKSTYYRSKLAYEEVDEDFLKSQAEGYVRALQWNLHYYYHGCQSWSWFYPHHYSPFVSDVTNFKEMDLKFEMGKPFLPFHQLLAVLPPGSKAHLPEAYWPLMTSEDSPIIDFYPQDFATDLNGKQQEWEAVVLIPFIEEDRLLEAMDKCKDDLTEDENRRNRHGPMQLFTYTKSDLGEYKSEMFPTIQNNHAQVKCVWPHEIEVQMSKLQMGLRPGFDRDFYLPGFASLRFVPHIGEFKHAGVKIFNFPAREKSIIITVTRKMPEQATDVASTWIGQTVYVGWPHMVEAKIVAVADESVRCQLSQDGGVKTTEHKGIQANHWGHMAASLVGQYAEKKGITLPAIDVIVYACRLDGQKLTLDKDGKVHIEKLWSKKEDAFPLQTTLKDLKVRPPTRKLPSTVEELYPIGDKVILLASPNYGAVAEIIDTADVLKDGLIKVKVASSSDPDVTADQLTNASDHYVTAAVVCRKLSMNQGVFARVTGACYLQLQDKKSINIGLNLKFNKKNEEVPGYTKKDGMTWLYSQKTIDLVNKYWEQFPEIFKFLNVNDTMDFTLDDIYGKGKGTGKDAEIVEWLKKQPHSAVAPTRCGTEMLGPGAIAKLEAMLDSFKPHVTSSVIKVKPAHMFKSDIFSGGMAPVPAQHQLMDRVVCCRTSYSVPLGLRGFIVAVQKGNQFSDSAYDVIFDVEFPSGISLHGSSPHRAYRLAPSAFINITAERRTNPLLKLREMPASLELRPAAVSWHQEPREKSSSMQPSAFAFVNQSPTSPYPGPSPPHPIIAQRSQPVANQMPRPLPTGPQGANPYSGPVVHQPIPVQNAQPATNQIFQQLWAEMGQTSKPEPKPKIDETGKDDLSSALMKALNIGQQSNTMPTEEPSAKTVRQQSTSANSGRGGNALLQALQISNPPNYNYQIPLSENSGKSYCFMLMAHFERKGCGVPKYKVMKAGGGLMAQVTIPNGQVCWGVPSETRETALESAALKALEYLGLAPSPGEPRSELVPSMPNPSNSGLSHQYPPYQPVNPRCNPPRPSGRNEMPPEERTRVFLNSNYQSPSSRNPRPLPGQNWLTPSSGLPMPPSNWRSSQVVSQQSSVMGSIPPSLIPQQALTQQRATRGMGPHKSQPPNPDTELPGQPSQPPLPNPVPKVKPSPANERPQSTKNINSQRKQRTKIAANLPWRDPN